MKNKIFQALKTSYSHLGLGDEILMEHANSIAALGLVTDDNLTTVISAQADFLAKLQKFNDKRVNDAIAKTKKEAEDEAAKKAAEEAEAKRKADEEAAKKAAEEEAKRKAAEEEAAKKAAEEEEARKKAEELKKNTEIPDWFKKKMEEDAAAAKAQKEAYDASIKAMQDAAAATKKAMEEQLAKLAEANQNLTKGYEQMKQEAEAAQKAKQQAERKEYILNKAKALEIPQYRIDEGFSIGDDLDNAGIDKYLTTISDNIKNNSMPHRPVPYPQTTGESTKEELAEIADMLVR